MNALQASVATKPVVLTYWWTGHANFGDRLTSLLLSELAPIAVQWAEAASAQLVACGSVATHLPRGWSGVVWGTGKARQYDRIDLSAATVLALRGKLTAKDSGATGQYALGDPGLLASLLVDHEPIHDVGLVPHWQDRSLTRWWKGHIIDVTLPPLEVIRQIASCRRIVSSSFHGIVVADALGIPRRWERASRVFPFKFADHGSVVGAIQPGRWDVVDPVVVARVRDGLLRSMDRLPEALA